MVTPLAQALQLPAEKLGSDLGSWAATGEKPQRAPFLAPGCTGLATLPLPHQPRGMKLPPQAHVGEVPKGGRDRSRWVAPPGPLAGAAAQGRRWAWLGCPPSLGLSFPFLSGPGFHQGRQGPGLMPGVARSEWGSWGPGSRHSWAPPLPPPPGAEHRPGSWR